MPIFEYKCQKCGKITEILQKNSSSTAKCQQCGSGELKKLFSGFSVGSSQSSQRCDCDKSCQDGRGCPFAG